jgi:hypothetical protein
MFGHHPVTMREALGWAAEKLRSFYGGRTVENVGSEELYELATNQLQNDPFRIGFEQYDGDGYGAVSSKSGRGKEIPKALLEVENEVPSLTPKYSVELTMGRHGGLKLNARTEFDRNYNLRTPTEILSLDSEKEYRRVGAVDFETQDIYKKQGFIVEQFGQLSTKEAVEILEGQA